MIYRMQKQPNHRSKKRLATIDKLQNPPSQYKTLQQWMHTRSEYIHNSIYDAPITVHFGLTYACNLSCTHCYSTERKTRVSMNFTKALSLLNYITSWGCFNIVLSHGESLLYPQIFKFLKKSISYGLHTTLISNGLLIDFDLAARIADLGLSRTLISLDSIHMIKHDKLRGKKGAWKSAVNAIENLVKAKANTGIAIAVFKENDKELEKLIDFGHNLGINYFNFMTVRPTSKDSKNLISHKKQYMLYLKHLWRLRKKLTPQINIIFHDPLIFLALSNEKLTLREYEWLCGQNVCFAGRAILSIVPDGDVFPCNFITQRVGNLDNDNENLLRIWRSNSMKIFRQKTKQIKCVKCKVFPICNGGCHAFFVSDKYGDYRCFCYK